MKFEFQHLEAPPDSYTVFLAGEFIGRVTKTHRGARQSERWHWTDATMSKRGHRATRLQAAEIMLKAYRSKMEA